MLLFHLFFIMIVLFDISILQHVLHGIMTSAIILFPN